MKLIGLSGTNGSGKDTVGHFLAKQYDYLFISVSDLLRDECRARNLLVDRENLRTISAEWRREGGLGVLIDKAVAVYEKSTESHTGLVVASLRHPGEVDRVHELKGQVIWVDANPKIRYERIQATAVARGRAAEDTKTFDEFRDEERAEMQPSGDAATLNMTAVREQADIQLLNETTLEQLQSDTIETLHL